MNNSNHSPDQLTIDQPTLNDKVTAKEYDTYLLIKSLEDFTGLKNISLDELNILIEDLKRSRKVFIL